MMRGITSRFALKNRFVLHQQMIASQAALPGVASLSRIFGEENGTLEGHHSGLFTSSKGVIAR